MKNIYKSTIILIIIILVIGTIDYIITGPHGIGIFQESYVDRNGKNWYLRFKLSSYPNLKRIVIGPYGFKRVNTFKINRLNRLKTISIGSNSFTWLFTGNGNGGWKSFHILNCESLESIYIGQYSFSGYGGEFELKNLPQLQSIQIGECYSPSDNFRYSSFVVRGIELILNI